MARWLRQLERRLAPFAVPHVTLGIVAVQVIAYVGAHVNPDLLDSMLLEPRLVWAGEVWRLVTFLAIPPLTNALFAFFVWYLFWLFGSALDETWGTFRYNLFLLIGAVLTIAASLSLDVVADNQYLGLTVFLAFATLYPDFRLLLMFIIPVKVKWLAWASAALLVYGLVDGGWSDRIMILASIANYLLFFAKDLYGWVVGGGRRVIRKATAPMPGDDDAPFHRCVVCRRTDRTDPDLDFRYDYDAEGKVQCYCEDHLPVSADGHA